MLTACTSVASPEANDSPSAECEGAVKVALEQEETLRSTHPTWVNDAPVAEPGTPEADEWAALVEDEQVQWTALMTPVYQTCKGPGDWYLAAKKYPELMGMSRADAVTPDMLEGWCVSDPTLAACAGYEEWLEEVA